VALVVDVETVFGGVVFQVGDVSRDIDNGHSGQSLTVQHSVPARRPSTDRVVAVDDDALLSLCHRVADAVSEALSTVEDWSPAGERPGQYAIDLVADRAVLEVLDHPDIGVVSEESGVHRPQAPLVAVVDPVDGSTNAARGIPWYATSVCVLDRDGPRVAVVANLANGVRYSATRHGGARRDGARLSSSGCEVLADAVVAIAGMPRRHLGWAQFRAFGAAALDICGVADGSLDAFAVGEHASLAPWDYLGALLVCSESGACAADLRGRDLVTTEAGARRAVVAAASERLLDELLAVCATPSVTSSATPPRA
jgi:myo-inositol-1(or 4)-monophosphatase